MENAATTETVNNNIRIAGISMSLPVLDERANAAKVAIEHHRAYVNMIDCDEVDQVVANELAEVKRMVNQVKEEIKAQKKPFVDIRRTCQEGMDRIDRQFGPLMAYLDASEKLLKGERTRWLLLEEGRKRREQIEAQAQQQAEAKRLAEEARTTQARAAEEARRKQEEAATALTNGDAGFAAQLEAEAQDTIAAAKEHAQLRLEESEAVLTAPVVATRHVANTVKGQSLSHGNEAELFDLMAALQGVIDGVIPVTTIFKQKEVNLVGFNMTFFNSEAARLGPEHFNYPGFRVKPKVKLNVRG